VRALSRFADATTLDAKAAALAEGARSCVPGSRATALLFDGDRVIGAGDPPGEPAFALRDGSAELRRLFLHALTRFGEGETRFAPRGRQRALVGVSRMIGSSDLLFATIGAGSRSFGVVVLQVEGEPPQEARDALAELCAVAARFLDTQRLRDLAERESRGSQLLAMVNERLHRSLDRRDMLFSIVEGVRSSFDAQRCLVYERMQDGEHAAVIASAVASPVYSLPKKVIPLDADLRKLFAGQAIRRDILNEGTIYGPGAQSAVAFPFVVEGRVEQALVLAFDRSSPLADADVAALRALAFHIGLALSNARLYERERERRTQAESLEHVVRILRDTQYVDEVLLVFVVTVSHELPVDCIVYALEDELLARRAMRVRDPRAFEPAVQVDRALLEPVLSVDDPSDAALLPRMLREVLLGDRGGTVVPLRVEGALWGCIVVRADDRALEWSSTERATFFRTLGSHLEIALANARAYEREQRAKREMQESSAFKDDLLAMLAHDFKGPLSVILGYCELMLESGAEYREDLETIHAQAERLVRLSEDALVLARTQAEGFSLDRTIVDFAAFVAESVEACAPGSTRIVLDAGEQGIRVEIDPTRLRHVIDNLLSNALKYSTATVDVRVRAEPPNAVLEVSDRGIGIPPDELSGLFTRFGRASNARERGIAGSGIGLYIARKIVEAHRGNITVRSRENEGSTFVVLLPLAGATS
jgi:signal transduction histidine kinase